MKVVILIPVYKRPEVLAKCLRSLKWFIGKVSWQVQVVCLLSPEDKDLKQNEKTVKKYGHKRIYYENLPVSDKINAGIEYIVRHYEFDYLMNFGSDDLIHPQIEQLYQPFFDKKTLFFGINTLYFIDLLSGKTIFFDTYNTNGSIGAGRMIHYSLLKRFTDQMYPLYEPGICCGMDTSSAISIKRVLGVYDIIVDSGKFPYIVDMKTLTNINSFFEIESRTDNITPVHQDYLKQFYPIL